MFRNKLANEIEKIEKRIVELENKLDFVFSNFSPEDERVECCIMSLSENIVFLRQKKEKLEETFWSLV